MSHNYTFHAYKPDSADICMGCLMASYSSDEVFEYELGEEEVVVEWAKVLSIKLDTGERGYEEVHLLQDGIRLSSGDPDHDRLYELARAAADRIIEERERAARMQKEADERRAAEKRESQERAEFERLKQKFGE